MQSLISHSEEETAAIAEKIAGKIKSGTVISLVGTLGAGKTFFTSKLVSALGSSDQVTSPTFGLMNIYTGRWPIYHFDLYRLENEDELADFGFFEYVEDERAIKVIEWGDRFPAALPLDRLEIRIEHLAAGSDEFGNKSDFFQAADFCRRFTFSPQGEKVKKWWEEWGELC